MHMQTERVDALVAYCHQELGDPSLWIQAPGGYPRSLALCLIDAIYSTGSHYTSVVNVINRYRRLYGESHGARALLASFSENGGPKEWASRVASNMKPANTRANALLKADVVAQAAQLMINHGVDTVEEFVHTVAGDRRNNRIHTDWKKLPSQSSGVTCNYLLILAGLPSVKPDRMVLRFLSDALGGSGEIKTDQAIALVEATADQLGVSPSRLDHIIWRAASGRELSA